MMDFDDEDDGPESISNLGQIFIPNDEDILESFVEEQKFFRLKNHRSL